MAARYVEQFTIRTADELRELEAAIGEGQLEAVIVDVPEGASAFQTAREFRHLLTVARAADVDIEFSSEDPLRQELARILGLRLVSDAVLDSSDADADRSDDSSDNKTVRIIRSTVPQSRAVTSDVPTTDIADTRPTFRPWQRPRPDTHENLESDEEDDDENDDDGSYSFVIHPPSTRKTSSPAAERQTRSTDVLSTSGVWQTTDYHDPFLQPSSSRRRRLRPLAWLSLLVTVGLVGTLLMMFLLPSATIAITPVESSVSASLTYGVALPGTNWDIAVPTETISTTVRFSATVPTSGERFVADQPARGSVLLTNASTTEILVPVGTILTTVVGQQFATTSEISVPAADPYGSLTIGSASVDVAAVVPGPESNVGAEAVFGQLESGIYFLNREPIAGGSMRRIATVSEADTESLRAQASVDLDEQANGAVATRLVDDQQLLADSEKRGQIQYSFNHDVGADADAVAVDASMTISAEAYSLTLVHDRARTAVVERLRNKAGESVTVLAESLETSEPTAIEGFDDTAFAVFASATVRSVIEGTNIEAIRTELAGTDVDAAVERIQQIPGVGSVTIDNSPSWLAGRMPRVESRIQIEVVNAPRVQAETTSPRP